MRREQTTLFVTLLFTLLASGSKSTIVAAGGVGGDGISSEVDSAIARYFLEDYLSGKRTNPQWDARIDVILKDARSGALTNEKLKAIADQTSVDFSAMIFAHLQTERNLATKEAFLKNYELVKKGQVNLREAAHRYKIVLIPGLFYRSKPETKGDLREAKATLEAAGFEVVSVPIHNAGTVEQNAQIIADFLKKEPTSAKEFMLVSTSKGGPDTVYALGHLMDQETAAKVAIWFSVGGALRGSLLADQWARWPRRWLASIAGLFAGFSVDMVKSLSVSESLKRMEQVRIPSHVCVVHFVGVPLSGTVIDEIKGSYRDLRRHGPNDGITLLPDEIVEGSTVITALGLDHWYRDPDLKRKILALVSTVTDNAATCGTPGEKKTGSS